MARVAGEAKASERQWTLVFRHGGYQRRLQIKGFLAGHDTKSGLMELGGVDADEGVEDVLNFPSDAAVESLAPHSVSKTDVEIWNNKKADLCRMSTEKRGPRPGPPLSPNPPPTAAQIGGRGRQTVTCGYGKSDMVRPSVGTYMGRQTTCKRWELVAAAGQQLLPEGDGRQDVVISRQLENSRGGAARETTCDRERLPVLTTNVRVQGLLPSTVAAAGPLSVKKFAMPPCTDDLTIRHKVDNFALFQAASYQLVSVTELPVYIGGMLTGASPGKVILIGTVGHKMIKESVHMWSLVLHPRHEPQYLLKTKKGDWVRLLNATDEYRNLMSDVQALGHFLNFVKKLPNASPMAAEEDLRKMCSTNNSKPQLDRLSGYIKVIRSFIEQDVVLARASILRKIFPNLFSKNSSTQTDEEFGLEDRWYSAGVKRKAGMLSFTSDGTERKEKRYKVTAKNFPKPVLFKSSTSELQSEHDSDYEHGKRDKRVVKHKATGDRRLQCDDDLGTDYEFENDLRREISNNKIFTPAEVNVEDPPVCIICDDGGNLIYCDGPCHRHFHPTKTSGVDSFCKTLGMIEADVKAIDKYFCPNCKHNQQQCFICGELGSSVATSDGPQEVRCCDVPFCNRFFHSQCVAELLCDSREYWTHLADAINNDDAKLLCPRHCCCVCGASDTGEPGKFVQCRRCPKAWHRSCLTDFPRSMQRPTVRIWSQHGREFIYCRDHKILPKIQTPVRDHLRFPTAAW